MKQLKQLLRLLSMAILILVLLQAPALAATAATTELLPSYHLGLGEPKMISLEVQNSDHSEHSFTFKTEGMSNSYELYFSTAELPIITLVIPAERNVALNLNLKLIGEPLVNNDTILVKVIRDDGQEMTMKMSVLINKDYQLELTSLNDKVEIFSGKAVELTFSVKNSGAKEIKAIKLSSKLPAKWLISKGADTSIDLKPGETGIIKTTLEVPSSQIAGNMAVNVIAVSNETQSNQVDIAVTVKTSANIAYWMIGLFLVIAVITVIQFKKHGRR